MLSQLVELVERKRGEEDQLAKNARLRLLKAFHSTAEKGNRDADPEAAIILLRQAGWSPETLAAELQEVDRVYQLGSELVNSVGAVDERSAAMLAKASKAKAWEETEELHFEELRQLEVIASSCTQRISDSAEAKRLLVMRCPAIEPQYAQDTEKLNALQSQLVSMRTNAANAEAEHKQLFATGEADSETLVAMLRDIEGQRELITEKAAEIEALKSTVREYVVDAYLSRDRVA